MVVNRIARRLQMALLSRCRSSRIGLSVGAVYLIVQKWFQGEETAGETWNLPRGNNCLIPQAPSPLPIQAHSQPFPSSDPSVSPRREAALTVCVLVNTVLSAESQTPVFLLPSVSLCDINTKRNLTIWQYMSRLPRHLFISLWPWAYHCPTQALPCSLASLDLWAHYPRWWLMWFYSSLLSVISDRC